MSDEIIPRPLKVLSKTVAWISIPLFLIGLGILFWLNHQLGQPVDLLDWMIVIGSAVSVAVGVLLVAKRPENVVSWIMAAIGLMVAIFPVVETYAAWVMTTRGRPDALAVFGVWANEVYWIPLVSLIAVYLPLLFPNGRLISRWWRIPAAVVTLAVAGFIILSAFRETLIGQNIAYEIRNPIGIAGLPSVYQTPAASLLIGGILFGMLSGVTATIVRYRRSKGVERQQLKWFLFAAALTPLAFIPFPWPLIADLTFGLALVGIPVAVAIALLRYRLYDIDVIIRKTLVYGVLTGTLAVVYFGTVVVLQSLAGRLTGVENSPAVIVISTLLIAALFGSLRRKVQQVIDQRFFRQKYNAEQVLARFGRTARDEVELEKLTAELVQVVEETMRPESVSLWIRPTTKLKP